MKSMSKCKHMKISFVWQGISQQHIREHWKDGLYAAMQLLEKEHDIEYCEPWDEMTGDVILYWEAPCTIQGENSRHYMNVINKPQKKILLFAGGPIKKEWVNKFDLVCVESKINLFEFERLGITAITAFGINENIFKPMECSILYDGIHHGTCASWKRQELLGEALGDKSLIVGREQETDRMPFEVAKRFGAIIIPEQSYEKVAKLINQSFVMVQTANEHGGGQRATLEAMACGVPVVCMSDSPKNREFVEESGFGIVCDPNRHSIYEAVEELKKENLDIQIGVDYIKSKWTSKHYADALKIAIDSICDTQS